MNYDQVISDLKKKIYHPVYFLFGEEPYYIDKITDYISEKVLTPEEQSFNQTVLYGKDSDAATIINTAKRFPMMANYQVVIVKEAQEVRNFEEMVHYLKQPLNSTLLVFAYKYKKPDGRKKVFMEMKSKSLWFESKKLYNDKIPDWISTHLKGKGFSIEPKAAVLLSEFLGNDLSKIEKELEKLVITLPETMKIITPDHVERNIGISKEYNIFEFQNALVARDPVKANRIINYFAANPKSHNITVIITQLYFYFVKILRYHSLSDKSRQNVASQLRINPFFVRDYENAARVFTLGKLMRIFSVLREYDLKSKGYGNISSSDGDLLKELTFKILH